MPDQRLRQLLQDVYDTHVAFHKEIDKGQRWVEKEKERTEIVVARDRFNEALHHLFVAKLTPLRNSFLNDVGSSIDSVIDFLEIDIPAFRCGYEKEWYLNKLKSLFLNRDQQDRLRTIALDLVSKSHYRREFQDWCRLMIVHADQPFLARLQELSASDEHWVQQKAKRMLDTIANNRRDLSHPFSASL